MSFVFNRKREKTRDRLASTDDALANPVASQS